MRGLLATVPLLLGGALVWGQVKPKPKVQELKSDLRKIQNQKGLLQRQLSKTKRQVRIVRGDLRQIDGRLDQLENDLEVTGNRLSVGRIEQARLSEELKVRTHLLQLRREQVRQRLRWMYVHQGRGVVSALLTSQDTAQFAARTTLLERIAKADRDLFDQYRRLRSEVDSKKRRQDSLVVEIASLKATQDVQHEEVRETRQDKAVLLGQLRDKQVDLEKLIRELDREESAIEMRIAAYNAGAGKTSGLKPFTGRFSRPVSGAVTSGFGMRFHPILKRSRMHNGIDFGAGHGAPISAPADGIVIASTYTKGYGNMIILDHGGGVSTLYGHCSRLAARPGQRVSRGQVIGYVGATGLATGPHLHWEVRLNGRPVNPMGKF